MRKYYIFLLAFFLTIFAGCAPSEKVDIYASIYPVYYLACEITKGTDMTVKQVYPPGADVHEYDPGSSKAILKLSKAKILFYIGSSLEGFIEQAKDIIKKTDTNLRVVELSENIRLCKYEPPESLNPDDFDIGKSYYSYANIKDNKSERGLADKHIWLDPLRMKEMARIICNQITEIDEKNKETYETNFNDLSKCLDDLDDKYKEEIKGKDDIHKIMIVDHDAYLYWEERYGIKRVRTRYDNESCDINPKDFKNIIAIGEKYNIKKIVVTRHEIECKLFKRYEKALDAEIVELNAISTLYKKEIKEGYDYISIMENNLKLLKEILPEK